MSKNPKGIIKPSYKVRIENEPEHSFATISEALDYASRIVYLPTKDIDITEWTLQVGQTASYSYGLKTVEIEATAPLAPYSCLIAAAPEMLNVLKEIEKTLSLLATNSCKYHSEGSCPHPDEHKFHTPAREALIKLRELTGGFL